MTRDYWCDRCQTADPNRCECQWDSDAPAEDDERLDQILGELYAEPPTSWELG